MAAPLPLAHAAAGLHNTGVEFLHQRVRAFSPRLERHRNRG